MEKKKDKQEIKDSQRQNQQYKNSRGTNLKIKYLEKKIIRNEQDNNFNLQTCFKHQNIPQIEGYERNSEDYYYDSYSHFNIHEEMLKDKVRTRCYMNSIIKNKHLFENKIVLDIGCGTGILSIFAAQAGAKHVYGVENANIAKHARKIIEKNNLNHKITIIQGKIEEVELPVQKVDIIISEWIGYFLLYESMLDCILDARDKYLNQNGLMFPDKAIMCVSSFQDDSLYEQRFNFWNNVYNVDMSCIKQWVFKEPLVEIIEEQCINSSQCDFKEFDLYTVKKSDLDFVSNYSINIRNDSFVQGLVVWWEVHFQHGHTPLKISSSPFNTVTHWKQTIFFINEEKNFLQVFKGNILKGKIAVQKNENNIRDLDIKIQFKLNNQYIEYDKSFVYKLN
ncbi:protein arginine n-methyltransferase, putative [Ichthyophthirius multifiliis]|uniref:Protein arginine n-methyltransferase, putative n=1 Tax=Ichthyophthirius multifiliis TaxID=5932 RepID=G0QJH2_ICHMU|nr:protein arginine n-methyltransferase, putative [Ichthyophthirius multifiliis]EGR34623.1 protein arginine n-methyltransferase, putative [Ichthyophthirius multifiliis]|eukprot:XP_004039927.1 protein arginine n-methyltransferase, putative [Ichthyophthirius multifiliis]